MSYGRTAGTVLRFDIGKVFHAQWTLLGTANGSPAEFDAMIDHIDKVGWQPVIDSEYALADISAAHEWLESADRFGKVVVSIPA